MFKDLEIMKTMNNTIINSIMKANIKFICAVLLLMGISAHAWAQAPSLSIQERVNIGVGDFTNYNPGGANGATVGVVSVSTTQNYIRECGNHNYVHIISGSTMTVTANSGKMTQISFSPQSSHTNCPDANGINGNISANSGTVSGSVWTSATDAGVSSVVFTASANADFQAFTVTLTHSSVTCPFTFPTSVTINVAVGDMESSRVNVSGTTGYTWNGTALDNYDIGGASSSAYEDNTSASGADIVVEGAVPGTYYTTLDMEYSRYSPYSYYNISIPVTVNVTGCMDIRATEAEVSASTPIYNCSTNYWESTISWEAISGATRYNVRMMKYNGSAFAYIGEWYNAGTSLSHTYTNLEAGEYRAKVVAVNQDCPTIVSSNDNHSLYGDGQGASEDFEIICPSVTALEVLAEPTMTGAYVTWNAAGDASCDMLYEVSIKKHSDNSVAWSQSPASSTNGATITGLTSNTTYDVYVTATNDCGNSNNNGGAYVEQFTTTRGYTDNKWTCIDLRLVQTDGNTSDPLLITGGYGLGTSSVEATRTLTLTIGGVTANSTVQLSGTNLKFFKNNDAHTEIGANNLKCDASGNLSAVIKVEYAPSTYTDDNIATPGITVTCDGNERTFNDLVKARCLPEKFVIATKVHGRWCALPADLATAAGATLQDAYPISVDNESAPRVATVVPKAAVYGFSARNYVTKHTGGIRLDTKTSDGNDGHLQAPRSNSSGRTYLWRTSGNNTTGMQDWYLTSKGKSDANFYTYYIGVDPTIKVSSTDGDETGEGEGAETINRYLCVYDNKIMWSNTSDKEFRILPIEDEIVPVDMQVVEWKADKVRFMYFGPTTYTASVEINGVLKSAAPAEISTMEIDHGVYEIAVSDLMTSAYKPLYIIIKNGDTEVGRKEVSVPLLVNTTTTIDAVRTAAGISNKTFCSNVDLVVLNNGKLSSGETTTDAQFTFNSITVYGGGKLILPENNYLTAKKMYLRAGTVNGGTYQYVYPQVYVGSNAMLTINDNILNFDYLTTKNQYYALALPFSTTVDNTHITYPLDIYGSTYAKGGSYLMDIFNGATRAAQGAVDAVWEDVEDVVTTRGLGYYFLGMPRKVSVNGGTATRQEYGIQRIQMSTSSALAIKTHENSDAQIAVTAYPADQPYNTGWWYLGNPYMADLGGAGVTDDGTKKEITMGYLGTNAQGQSEWKESNVRYVTVPNDEAQQTYDQRPVSEYTFPAFKTFYVQVGHDGYVKFGHANRASAAPKRFSAKGMPSEIKTSVALNSATYGDTTHILIGDEFTDDYEIGDDLIKMPHTNVSLFTISGENDLFANALNPQSALNGIPVGYTAPEKGKYVFSHNDKMVEPWVGNLWLIDYKNNVKIDLLEETYEFETEAETNKTRFVLNVELRSPSQDDPTTGNEAVDAESNDGPYKFLYQDKIYIRYNGIIYDAVGKKVSEIK